LVRLDANGLRWWPVRKLLATERNHHRAQILFNPDAVLKRRSLAMFIDRAIPRGCVLAPWLIAFCSVPVVAQSSARPAVSLEVAAEQRLSVETIPLWSQKEMPGRVTTTGEEADTSTAESAKVAGMPVIRLGNVSQPTISVYAPAHNPTGAAVLVCPGGGYHILAMDLEGTEVAEWLNRCGVTAFVLKYRVPRGGSEVPIEPLMDAQRAMSLIRSRAAEWSIDENRIGVLGFSAGGNLAARLSTSSGKRVYDKVDGNDEAEFVPNFALLIYPAYLFDKGSEELISKNLELGEQTPPVFITMAMDDPVDAENALRFGLAMKRAGRPIEVHLYASGGHGYGLRRTESAATGWIEPAAVWLKSVTAAE
jgi:acetyl esterase/lipase